MWYIFIKFWGISTPFFIMVQLIFILTSIMASSYWHPCQKKISSVLFNIAYIWSSISLWTFLSLMINDDDMLDAYFQFLYLLWIHVQWLLSSNWHNQEWEEYLSEELYTLCWLRANLGRITLVKWSVEARVSNSLWYYCLARVLNSMSREMQLSIADEKSAQRHSFLSTPDCGCNVTSCLKVLPFLSTTMGYELELEVEVSFLPLHWFWWFCYHSNWNETREPREICLSFSLVNYNTFIFSFLV